MLLEVVVEAEYNLLTLVACASEGYSSSDAI